MQTKHLFASANTGIGFVKNFDQIGVTNNSFMFIIKGGSGTGKSSMMKKIAKYFLEKGEKIEYFYCSTDYKSLDGIRICDSDIIIVDGTSPHITETNMLNIDSKIIDVGQFVKDGIREHKKQIEKIMIEKTNLFKNLYLYLESAKKIFDINKNIHKTEESVIIEKSQEILNIFKPENQNRKSFYRELFLSAVQDDGMINLIKENNFKNCYKIKSDIFCSNEILKIVKDKLSILGYDIIGIKNVIDPSIFDAIIIPESESIIYSENLDCENEGYKQNSILIKEILKLCGQTLGKAKSLHKKLEEFYIQNMNFKEVDKLTKKIIAEILKLIKQKSN
ncbi:MAG: hypothetical protein IJ837_00990 [Clostridia bacterium]|nr:hypothetical protein [Clostridia bacterium]